MTTKEFVEWALKEHKLTQYRLGKYLKLSPVSIAQYLRGTRMSNRTAAIVLAKYNVTITDAFWMYDL